jgi:hypothetical protein
MSIDLQCPQCDCCFDVESDTPAGAALDRLAELGPWTSLGDGETTEDLLHAELSERGALECPECGSRVLFGEAELGQIALQLLVQW